MQVSVENLLEGSLTVGVKQIDALTTQLRSTECSGELTGHGEHLGRYSF